MKRYPICKPYITHEDEERVARALASGWVGAEGPELEEFASRWAELHERSYCVLTSSGTAALRLAYQAAGVGDCKVVLPSLTFQATAAALPDDAWLVFVDVREDGCMDPEKVKGVDVAVSVALYGVKPIVPRHVMTIVDAAQCHAVPIDGDVLCYSFAANKVVTTGMGGALLTDSHDIYERARLLSGHAGSTENRYQPVARGHNCRMSNVAAALGCSQLDRLDSTLAARWQVFEAYAQHFDLWPGPAHVVSPWLVTIRVPAARRDAIAAELAAQGIETRPTFPGLHRSPCYAQYVSRWLDAYQVTDRIAAEGLSLPTWVGLGEADVGVICAALEGAWKSS